MQIVCSSRCAPHSPFEKGIIFMVIRFSRVSPSVHYGLTLLSQIFVAKVPNSYISSRTPVSQKFLYWGRRQLRGFLANCLSWSLRLLTLLTNSMRKSATVRDDVLKPRQLFDSNDLWVFSSEESQKGGGEFVLNDFWRPRNTFQKCFPYIRNSQNVPPSSPNGNEHREQVRDGKRLQLKCYILKPITLF